MATTGSCWVIAEPSPLRGDLYDAVVFQEVGAELATEDAAAVEAD